MNVKTNVIRTSDLRMIGRTFEMLKPGRKREGIRGEIIAA
jgi:hypothetical protein